MASNKRRGRGPVVHLDRLRKAQMIEAIIQDHLGTPPVGLDLLDIGSGNGDISEFFARNNRVRSVDVSDQRRRHGAATFSLVEDEHLPFEDSSLDIVLSHHVIEHVANQRLHLAEIRRVLRPTGSAYLATPNRSSPIMEGHVDNDDVLRWHEMRPLFVETGFEVFEYGWRVVCQPDSFHAEQRFGRFIPAPLARMLRRFYPSHMFMLTPRAPDPN
ncbi:MAG: class I SAM-dependent methyltransferase [Acidimicrobiia bacterium]|nr:class I SAM-dependent methyltransferase [Acidimicrobiia bacterium]